MSDYVYNERTGLFEETALTKIRRLTRRHFRPLHWCCCFAVGAGVLMAGLARCLYVVLYVIICFAWHILFGSSAWILRVVLVLIGIVVLMKLIGVL